MDRRNYFEILGLEFDPAESKKQVIEKAIRDWERSVQERLGNETSEVKRAALNAELALKADMETTLKENKSRNLEAKALKEKRVAQLEQLIDIMRTGETGTLEVTNAQIRNVSRKLRLSADTVGTVYTKKGYVIQKVEKKINLKDVFITKATADKISGKLTQLRTMTSSQMPWASKVNSLFDFACFYSGGSESDLAAFSKKRTNELCSIMDSGAAKYATDMTDTGHLLQDLFTAGTTQIFNSEDNRKKYSRTLALEQLSGFFALLKAAPEDFKKDRYFAESCIRTIQKHFPDYNLALALYNQEAGLNQDPYEPIEAMIRVSCVACKTPAEFRTQEAAQKGSCAVCGAKLYVKCPKCGKHAPAAADRCACGFMISEMQFFDDYCRAVEFALTELDLDEAQKQYENADIAYPGHPKLATLRDMIEKAKVKFKPLQDLDLIIASGMMSKAQMELGKLAAMMPKLNLDSRRKKIAEALDLAQKRMPPPNASPTDRANRCFDILQTVKDFQPAIEMLRLIKPKPPVNLVAIARGDNKLTCTLSWNASGDKGVVYQVVRKRDGVPVSQSDGNVLAQNLTDFEYKDNSIEPGISYGYAVFACRYGTYSAPATCEVENYSDLNQVQAYAEDGVCHFSWTLPANCIGVRIVRRVGALPTPQLGGGSVIVADRAQANFDDPNVENGKGYGYRLQCVYPHPKGFRFSSGWTTMLHPDAPPVSIRNVKASMEGREVKLTWFPADTVRRTVTVREAISPAIAGIKGQDMSAQDINKMLGNGRIYMTTSSDAKQCRFEIPSNSVVSLAVITFSGSRGIVSDVIQVSSVDRCSIDRNNTRIEGERLIIRLSNVPKNLERIYYLVASKTDSSAPWATIDDAKNQSMSVVTVGDYIRDGMIVVNNPAKTDLYATVIGQYKMADSSVVYSEPSKLRINNKPKEVLKYQISWGGGLFWGSKPKNAKLIITTSASSTPEMQLLYRSDGHIPMKLGDPANIVLHTVAENDPGFRNGEYTFNFDDAVWPRVGKGAELRLMIDDDAMLEYELQAENIKNLKVP